MLHDFISETGALMLISAVLSRTTVKYGHRGYRFALIEAGHIGQNIYLLSEKKNLGCCALGGFLDDKLNELLDLENEPVIYALALGSKKDYIKSFKLPSSVSYDPLQLKAAKK
jgi:SagB-type dehydrogenase family enzyme